MAAVVVPLPLPLTELEACWKLPPVIAGSFWISSLTDTAPVLSIASREMTVTGKAPSAWMRRIEEPVISTRWVVTSEAASWAQAFAVTAASRAVQILVRLNMGIPSSWGSVVVRSTALFVSIC